MIFDRIIYMVNIGRNMFTRDCKINLPYKALHIIYDLAAYLQCLVVYLCFRPFPLKRKVVATCFNGKKYGDNTRYIIEKIHESDPTVDIVWIKDKRYNYSVAPYVRIVETSNGIGRIRAAYEYCTARAWLDTHLIDRYLIKRRDQLFIETWHGGLGIKRIEGDVEKFRLNYFQNKKIAATSNKADIFISNSDHLSQIYRRAFNYKGLIWKCGYPKNDMIVQGDRKYRDNVYKYYKLKSTDKILLYAPTFRKEIENREKADFGPYDINFTKLKKALEKKWKTDWVILVRWHPNMAAQGKAYLEKQKYEVIDATEYADMQELILSCSAFISDYSSCIFDAALAGVPCFIYAVDYDDYAKDRGTYYKMSELPFLSADNNAKLLQNIEKFDLSYYINRWNVFKEEAGLRETGHAADDIADLVNYHLCYGSIEKTMGYLKIVEK